MMLDMILPTTTPPSTTPQARSSSALPGSTQADLPDSGADIFAQLLLQVAGNSAEAPLQTLTAPWPNDADLGDRQLLAQMIAENSGYAVPALEAPMAEALRKAISEEAALPLEDSLNMGFPEATDLADGASAALQPIVDSAQPALKGTPSVAAATVLPTAAQPSAPLEAPAARVETPVLQLGHPTGEAATPAAATFEVPAPLSGEAPLAQSVHEPLSSVGAAQPTSATNTLAATQAAQSPGVNAPLNTPAWGRELGQQVVIATRSDEQQISLRLNPANLGPLQIELKVLDQQAQVQFLSPHAQVRGAVEQAIPQLREALAEQGITLADTSVGEQRQQQHDTAPDRRATHAGHTAADAQGDDIATVAEPVVQPLADGRINVYV